MTDAERAAMQKEIAAEIDAAFAHAKASPFPTELVTEGISS